MADPKELSVGIIGAGIAGLGAAIALRKAGHNVELYESSTFRNEIGAAITLTPNANLILDRWGFDAKSAGETEKQQFRGVAPDTLEMKMSVDFADVPLRFGHKFNAFHRVDMHTELRRLAVGDTGPGKPAKIHLSSMVTDIDVSEGDLVFEDGSKVRKDLIIAADGIKTRFLRQICGEEIPNEPSGFSVYRTLVPIDKLMADPVVRAPLENQRSGFFSALPSKQGVMCISYPCREDKIMNVAIFHTTKDHEHHKDDWNSPSSKSDALEVMPDAHPVFRAMIEHADEVKCFTLTNRRPIPHMNKGKAVIIGDAAHPMMPSYAQGGCMALEDSAAFEALFRDFTEGDSVEKRLTLYNQLRLSRDNVTQVMSNATMYARALGESERLIQKFAGGTEIPCDIDAWIPWGTQVQDFFYGYDAFAEAERAMKYKDKVGGVPDGVIKHFGSPRSCA